MGIEAVFGLKKDGEVSGRIGLPRALLVPGSMTARFWLHTTYQIAKLKTAPTGSPTLPNEAARTAEIAYAKTSRLSDLRFTVPADVMKTAVIGVLCYAAVYVAQNPG